MQKSKKAVEDTVQKINQLYIDATNSGGLDREKYFIPPHLHDLQEADLPETQRGLVISEIALFRERAAKREREKMKETDKVAFGIVNPSPVAPSGPKQREWGKPQHTGANSA